MANLRAALKQCFPNATKALADRYRWHVRLRPRHDFGTALRYRDDLRLIEVYFLRLAIPVSAVCSQD